MKDEIKTHEWDVFGMSWIQTCKVCSCKRELPTASRDHLIYKEFGDSEWTKKEPKCITRKIEKDGKKA